MPWETEECLVGGNGLPEIGREMWAFPRSLVYQAALSNCEDNVSAFRLRGVCLCASIVSIGGYEVLLLPKRTMVMYAAEPTSGSQPRLRSAEPVGCSVSIEYTDVKGREHMCR